MDFIKVSNRSNFNNTDNSKQSSSSLLSQSSSSVSSLSSNGNGVGCGGGGLTSGCNKSLNLKTNNVRNGTNGNNNNNNSSSYSNSTVSSSLNTTDSSNVSNSTATAATATSSSSSSNNINNNNNSNNKSDGGSVDDPETKNDNKDQFVECQRNVFQSSEQLLNNEFKTLSNTICDEKLLLKLQLSEGSAKGNLNNNLDGDNAVNAEVQDDYNEENEQRRPFLQEENEKGKKILVKKPKSIVKSPSTHSFAKDKIVSKPRLSFNCPLEDDLDRHVQFSHHDHPNGGYSKSDMANPSCSSPTGSMLSQGSGGSETSSSSSSNDNSSTEQYSEARPPDGGYGWVIVFASFLVNMIADGITFSFGVIFVEFLNYFGEGKAKTAWIGSLFMAMPLLSGPIASFLTDRYGCRKVTIVGSILASTGFVISAFATSTEMLFLTFGVIAGFGLSLCYVAAVVIVAYYFDKRRSFATGLSVCGSGIGTFVFAPLTQLLLEWYGWRGTTLIFAGIFLNMCVCGALMRDLEWTTHRAKLKRKNKKLECQASADSFSVSNSTNTGGTNGNLPGTITDEAGKSHDTDMLDPDDPRLFSSLIMLPTFIKNREKVPPEVLELLSQHRNVHEVLLQNYPGLLQSRSFSEPFSSHNGISSPDNALLTVPTSDQAMTSEAEQMPWMRRRNSHHQKGNRTPTSAYLNDLRMHRHSLTYRGAMLNINRYRLRASSCPDIYRNSMTTIAKEKTAWYQGIDEFKNLFVDILDLSYFYDIRFLLFAISNLLLYTWYDVPYVYLADNAIEMGYSEKDASILISVIGIVNMFGEIFLGWIGDKKSISPSFIYAICMIFCGITVGLVPLFNSYWSLIAISGAFGLFIAANYSLTSIILVELITLERFTNAYGLLLLVQGIANLIGPPLAGWVYDIIGTYDLSFYLAGIFISLSGLLLLVLPAIEQYKRYVALKKQKAADKTYQVQTQEISVESKSNGTTILSDCFGQKDLLAEVVKV